MTFEQELRDELIKKMQFGTKEEKYAAAYKVAYGRTAEPVDEELAKLALETFDFLAGVGDCDSMMCLGGMYLTGKGTFRDLRKAKKWYEKAVRFSWDTPDKETLANLRLAEYYYYNLQNDGTQEVTRDASRRHLAYRYFQRAACGGSPMALMLLGDFYMTGEFGDKDESTAFYYFRKAIDAQKDCTGAIADILLRLGDCLLYGNGAPEIPENARDFLYQSLRLFESYKENGELIDERTLKWVRDDYADAVARVGEAPEKLVREMDEMIARMNGIELEEPQEEAGMDLCDGARTEGDTADPKEEEQLREEAKAFNKSFTDLKLWGRDSEEIWDSVTVNLSGGCLDFWRHEISEGLEEIFGSDEYESWLKLDELNTYKLFKAINGLKDPVGALRTRFRGLSDIMSFCDRMGIDYYFHHT